MDESKAPLELSKNSSAPEEVVPVEGTPAAPAYVETDIFAWTNNLVQYVDELKIQLYFFNKDGITYRLKVSGDVSRQYRPLFLDEILEYVLDGVEKGLVVRGFEEAEKEENVLQRTKIANVDKLIEVLRWLKFEQHNIETFKSDEHDLKRMKGVIAVCSHAELKDNFYVIKQLPASQIMSGHTAWMLKGDTFKPFDDMMALKIPGENQLLAVGQDLFVFNQAKLKSLFGYDAKAAVIASKKVEEIEANFRLSFTDGLSMQALVKGKPATIKKLQNLDVSKVKQPDVIKHSDDMGIGLMTDDSGAIIIVDDKDLTRFVNLINDDYVESAVTGERYEVLKKRPLKPMDEEELLAREVL